MNIPDPSDGTADPGRRENLRASLGIRGKLVLLDGSHSCLFENISRDGACFLTRVKLAKGTQGILQCDRLDHFFEVEWENGGRYGVKFDVVVPKDVILRLRHLAENCPDGVDDSAWKFGREWVEGSAGHSVD